MAEVGRRRGRGPSACTARGRASRHPTSFRAAQYVGGAPCRREKRNRQSDVRIVRDCQVSVSRWSFRRDWRVTRSSLAAFAAVVPRTTRNPRSASNGQGLLRPGAYSPAKRGRQVALETVTTNRIPRVPENETWRYRVWRRNAESSVSGSGTQAAENAQRIERRRQTPGANRTRMPHCWRQCKCRADSSAIASAISVVPRVRLARAQARRIHTAGRTWLAPDGASRACGEAPRRGTTGWGCFSGSDYVSAETSGGHRVRTPPRRGAAGQASLEKHGIAPAATQRGRRAARSTGSRRLDLLRAPCSERRRPLRPCPFCASVPPLTATRRRALRRGAVLNAQIRPTFTARRAVRNLHSSG
jgi:hypothetical protein